MLMESLDLRDPVDESLPGNAGRRSLWAGGAWGYTLAATAGLGGQFTPIDLLNIHHGYGKPSNKYGFV